MPIRTVTFLLSILLLAACQRSPQPAEDAAGDRSAPASELAVQAEGDAVPEEGLHGPAPTVPPIDLSARDTTEVDTDIVNVRLSNYGDTEANHVGAVTSRFAPADTVYAEVETDGTTPSYTLYAKWIDSEGKVLADYGVGVGQAGRQRTVITLSKPDGWASGKNRIELAINGELERTVTFEVQ